jgi:hypothetical protein
MKSWLLLFILPFLFACTASDQAAPSGIVLPEEQIVEEEIPKEFEKSSGNCSETTERNFEQIIGSQMSALAQKDFASAYELTSERFKSGFSLDRFTGVISEFYPGLLDNTDFVGTKCLEMGFTGFYEIDVRSLSGDLQLRYRFEYVGDAWFIAGAEEMPVDESQVPA